MSDETTQTGKDATDAFLARAKKAMRSKSAAATGMPCPRRRNSRAEIRFQGANLSLGLWRYIFRKSILGRRKVGRALRSLATRNLKIFAPHASPNLGLS